MEGACLAHDLGHPPFGHNGEDALNELSQSAGGFEGNAQSLRLLIRLEAKTVDSDGKSVGLNLTRASLDAATKYPWPRATNIRKFGVYDDDLEIFHWIRKGAPEGLQSMEAQIMDWSDDVAYSVHDLEDAIVSGQVRLDELQRDIAKIFEMAKSGYLPDITQSEAESALAKLQSLSCWPSLYDGSHRHLARLKDLASQLVGRFALAAESATRDQYGDGNLTRYSANLVVPREQRVEVALLKAMAGHYVIGSESSQKRYAEQQILIKELVQMVYEGGEGALESFFIEDWRRASSDGERLRVAIDQIACLTDPGAYALHKKLSQR
jgi:dGTPase